MKHKPFFITLLFLHGSLSLCGVESAGGIVGTGGGVAESEHYKTVGVIGQVLGHPLVENHVVTNLGGYIPKIFPPATNPLEYDGDGDGIPLGWEQIYGLNEFIDDSTADPDLDGLSNLQEFQSQTSPLRADSDADGLSDFQELNVYQTNPRLFDGDGDGFSDGEEVAQGTDPNDHSDNPGVVTVSPLQNPFRRLNAAGARSAGGGLNNFSGVGVNLGTGLSYNGGMQSHSPLAWGAYPFAQNPKSVDGDGDGMPDYWEKIFGLNPFLADSSTDGDEDGVTNIQEFALSTSPVNSDTDGDGLDDYAESITYGSDPLLVDGDGDGYSDTEEVAQGNNPANASDYPGSGLITYQSVRTQMSAFGNHQSFTGLESFNSGGAAYADPVVSGGGLVNLVGLLYSNYEGGSVMTEKDSDLDGMPDLWERTEGLNELVNDAGVDADGDGLSNIQEYGLGTRALHADTDGDGLSDGAEANSSGTNALLVDSDGDGFSDGEEIGLGYQPTSSSNYPGWQAEITPYLSSAHSINDASGWLNRTGGSGFGLVGQPFWAGIVENTSLSNRSGFVGLIETSGAGTSQGDADGDGLPDVWESIHGFDSLVADATSDRDGDGLNEIEEFSAHTDPNLADTDGDGLSDYNESVSLGTSPILADSDGDGFNDFEEISVGLSARDASVYPGWDFVPANLQDQFHAHLSAGGFVSGGAMTSFSSVGQFVSPSIISDVGFSSLHGFIYLANPPTGDPRESDTDGDGMPDVWERTMGTLVAGSDAGLDGDGDGLSNLAEFSLGTNPGLSDTDGDSLTDGSEQNVHGSDPTQVDTDGDGYTDDQEVSEGSSPTDSGEIPASATLPVFLNGPRSLSAAGNGLQGTGIRGHFLVGSGIAGGIGQSMLFRNLHGFYYQSHFTEGDPDDADTDGDGMSDLWENLFGLDSTMNDSQGDLDGDGLLNGAEWINQTSPALADSDGDGLSDGAEVNQHGSDPKSSDGDGDGFSDAEEISLGMNPNDSAIYPGHDLITYTAAIRQLNAAGSRMGTSNLSTIFTIGQPISPTFSYASGLVSRNGLPATLDAPSIDPLAEDADGDQLPDSWEAIHGLSFLISNGGADPDLDGLSNYQEWINGTDPLNLDTDEDGVNDSTEVSVGSNPNLEDSDGDGFGDGEEMLAQSDPLSTLSFPGWDIPNYTGTSWVTGSAGGAVVSGDYSGHGLVGQSFSQALSISKFFTSRNGFLGRVLPTESNPRSRDTDADGMPDAWEGMHGLNIFVNDSTADADGDGLTNLSEFTNSTHALLADSDEDGVLDGAEVNTHSSDPLHEDSDGDGYTDGEEAEAGSSLTDPVSYPGSNLVAYSNAGHIVNVSGGWDNRAGGSGFSTIGSSVSGGTLWNGNSWSRSGFIFAFAGTNPSPGDADADGDSIPDYWEKIYGLNPLLVDSSADADGDGLSNLAEYQTNTDPFLNDTDGDGLSDAAEKNIHLTDPTQADPDGDGYSDSEELVDGTDPNDPTRYPGWNWGTKTYYSFIRGYDSAGAKQSASGIIEFSSVGSGHELVQNSNEDYTNLSGLLGLSYPPSMDSGDFDVDGDGMPDRWEATFQFDLTVNDSALDADGDGLSNLQEYSLNTDPRSADSDADGLSDAFEVNNSQTDPTQVDTDGDGFTDEEEVTDGTNPKDSQFFPGYDEYAGKFSEYSSVINSSSGWKTSSSYSSFGVTGQAIAGIITQNLSHQNRSGWVSVIEIEDSNPVDRDTDGDTLPDVWENAYGFDPLVVDSAGDLDGDGLSNIEEFTLLTNPLRVDTDGDGLADRDETNIHGTDPTKEDGDGDGFLDTEELADGTDPNRADRYPGWDFVVVNYQTPGHFHGVAGGWSSSSSPRHFSSVGDFRSVSVLSGQSLTSHTGFLFRVSTPPENERELDADEDGMPDYWERIHAFDLALNDSGLDTDLDGLSALQEFTLGTNPVQYDTDEDGISDGEEALTYGSNPLLQDSDGDGFTDQEEITESSDPGNAQSVPASSIVVTYAETRGTTSPFGGWVGSGDTDTFSSIGSSFAPPMLFNSDHSLIYGFLFSVNSTANPRTADTDSDGLPDVWEKTHGLNDTANDASADPDADGLSNAEEYAALTNPVEPDSDRDGLQDGVEINVHLTSPLDPDSDADGHSDMEEISSGTNPSDATRFPGWYEQSLNYQDSVSTLKTAGGWVGASGFTAFQAVGQNYSSSSLSNFHYVSRTGLLPSSVPPENNPNLEDTDGDLMSDLWELAHGFDRSVDDSSLDADGDGLTNYEEFVAQSNPRSTDSDEDGLSDFSEVKNWGTSPILADSDGDGFSDLLETDSSTDPMLSESYPGSTPPKTYISYVNAQNAGGNSGTGGGYRRFSSVGQPFANGTSKSPQNVLLTGFTFMTHPPDGSFSQADADGDSIPNLDEMIIGTSVVQSDLNLDLDGDGLSNVEEFTSGTDILLVDSDGDGLSDFVEIKNHNSNPLDPDSDLDGFLDGQEVEYGSDVLTSDSFPGSDLKVYVSFIHSINAGGNSDPEHAGKNLSSIGQAPEASIIQNQATEIRSGFIPFIGMLPEVNHSPTQLDFTSLPFFEGEAIGTNVGNFSSTDPDAEDTLTYSLVGGAGDMDNHLFVLDLNGSLSSGVEFDYESNASLYGVRVRVQDQSNAYLEGNFTVSLLNVVEDLDGDGVEDAFDLDDDGDGYSDSDELVYGSDPRDPGSLANTSPSALSTNGILSIAENLPVGTRIGDFLGTDPDAGDSLTYSLVGGAGDMDNHLFVLDLNGRLSSGVEFDYESNASHYGVRVRVQDQGNAYLEGNFTVSLLNVVENVLNPDEDGDGENSQDGDGDGLSDLEEMAFGTDPSNVDSDGDGIWDKMESEIGTDPLDLDTDGDGVSDLVEIDSLRSPLGTTYLSASQLQNNPYLGPDKRVYSIVKEPKTLTESISYGKTENMKLSNLSNDRAVKSFVLSLMRREGVERTWISQESLREDNPNLSAENMPSFYFSEKLGTGHSLAEGLKIAAVYSRELLVPIVGTLTPEINEGKVILRAKLHSSGGELPFRVGFVVADKIVGWENDADTQILDTELNGSEFEKIVTDLPAGKSFFIRSFAENSAGRSVGSVKRLKTPKSVISQPNLDTPFAPWVLKGDEEENSWIQNEFLGLIYFGSYEHEGAWFWSEGNGWLWCRETAWPYLWSQDAKNWVYFLGIEGQSPTFINNDNNSSLPSNGLTPIEMPEVLMPIVRTLDADNVEGDFWAKAKLLTDGGETPGEVGFIISESIKDWDMDSDVIKLTSSLTGDLYEAPLNGLASGKTYYIRAFARNSAGEIIGSIKRISIPKFYIAPFNAYSIGLEWYRSDWFGRFKKTDFDWIFHEDFGWLYHGPVEENGIWFWRERNGWLWSNSELWPYLWSDLTSSWFLSYGIRDGKPTFWDYQNNDYSTW